MLVRISVEEAVRGSRQEEEEEEEEDGHRQPHRAALTIISNHLSLW